MRILYASFSYLPCVGGGEIQVHGTARRMVERGHAARVLCQWTRACDDLLWGATRDAEPPLERRLDGVEVSRLGFSRLRRRAMTPWVAAYRRARPRPALASFASRRISALFARDFARAAGEPEIVHAVRIGQEFLARAAFDLARARGLPYVLTRLSHPPNDNPLHREYDRLAREADAVVAMTPFERDQLVEQRGVRPERVHVLGCAPVLSPAGDVEAFRAAHGIPGPYVLFLGRQVPHKGFEALLAAAPRLWRAHPELRFVFAGPSGRTTARAFAARDDARIVQLGVVDEATKAAALAGCELLCVPSTAESFGVVYLEAWAFGKPVVAGRIPPVASILEDGRTALLSSQDPGELAERIGWLLAHPSQARALGEAGRAELERRYTWKRIVDRMEALYGSLV